LAWRGVGASVATSATAPYPSVARQAEASSVLHDESGFTLTEVVNVGTETQAEYNNAIGLLDQKQYEQGIASLLKVTQSAPSVTAPFIDLGIAYSRSGDLDKAEASLRRALELNPRHPVAYNELGMVLRKKGQFAAARRATRRR
jgi:Flp pilus assembly protein TadD